MLVNWGPGTDLRGKRSPHTADAGPWVSKLLKFIAANSIPLMPTLFPEAVASIESQGQPDRCAPEKHSCGQTVWAQTLALPWKFQLCVLGQVTYPFRASIK